MISPIGGGEELTSAIAFSGLLSRRGLRWNDGVLRCETKRNEVRGWTGPARWAAVAEAELTGG